MIYVACGLELKEDEEKEWKKELKNLVDRRQKKKKKQLTVNAPGTETIKTFLPFHSLVDNVMADKLNVSKKKRGF